MFTVTSTNELVESHSLVVVVVVVIVGEIVGNFVVGFVVGLIVGAFVGCFVGVGVARISQKAGFVLSMEFLQIVFLIHIACELRTRHQLAQYQT